MTRGPMSIVIHIERLVVDDIFDLNVHALESAIREAVSRAALLQARRPARAQAPHDASREWAMHLGGTLQHVAGSVLGGPAGDSPSARRTP